jgi:hypothetical protein
MTQPDHPGVQVTLIDANHCPGAVQILFQLPPPDGRTFLHCGDMRYSPAMQALPAVQSARGCDAVFLDNTYCHPRHSAVPQQRVAIEFVASEVARMAVEDEEWQRGREAGAGAGAGGAAAGGGGEGAAEESHQQQQEEESQQQQQQQQQRGQRLIPPFRRLYLISTYVIGKERILLETAARAGLKVCVTARKHEVLALCLRDPLVRQFAGGSGDGGLMSVGGGSGSGGADGPEAAPPAAAPECFCSPEDVEAAEQLLARVFTTDPTETPIHVVDWGESFFGGVASRGGVSVD